MGKAKLTRQPTLDDQVDKILGATGSDGDLKFYMQFKGADKPVMVSAAEAKVKYPYHVLDFYESCLVWESEEDEVDASDDDKPLAKLKPNAGRPLHQPKMN